MTDRHAPVPLPDLTGKVAVVTGANGGLGWQTASALATAHAHVVLAGRNADALERAAALIREAAPDAVLDVGVLDLADQASIQAFSTKAVADFASIDLLINNAGVMAIPERRLTTDGFETTFGTNHLGHLALTGRLLPSLLAAPAARVVTVSAVIARRGQIDFDNLDLATGYRPFAAYAASKLANVAFAVELAHRAAAAGQPMLSLAVHPGTAMTGIQRHGSALMQTLARLLLEPLLGQSPEEAARPALLAATDPNVVNGRFYAPRERNEGRGYPGEVALPPAAEDAALRTRLWTVSEELTGVRFEMPRRTPRAERRTGAGA